jgi:hypothetical protein
MSGDLAATHECAGRRAVLVGAAGAPGSSQSSHDLGPEIFSTRRGA